MSSLKILDSAIKEIKIRMQNHISPKDRVKTAEKAKFLSAIQGLGTNTTISLRA